MSKHIFLVVFILIWNGWAIGQDQDHEEIKSVIYQIFDGMRDSDSSQVHKAFAEDVKFYSSARRKGKPVLFEGSLSRFLNSIGTPHEEVYDERISELKILVDHDLANAWMNYKFYVGDEFSHCGINTMTLHKSEDGWKIIFLADTRRKSNCLE